MPQNNRRTGQSLALMHLLLLNRNNVLRSETIIERVWGYDARGDTGSLKAHIRHLREKVESNPEDPVYLRTVRGAGYRFEVPGEK